LKKARLTPQDISSLTQLRKSDAMSYSSRPTTCKESVVTTTGTFNEALAMLEIWFFDESRMIPGYTSLTPGGTSLPSGSSTSQSQCSLQIEWLPSSTDGVAPPLDPQKGLSPGQWG
jgi:hypothetical protein